MHSLGMDYTLPAITANDKEFELNKVDKKYKYYLFDIEGTTTPITFVKDVLFPYASNGIKVFLESTWNDEITKADVVALYKQADFDLTDSSISETLKPLLAKKINAEKDSKEAQIEWLVEYVQKNITLDRKIGPLKQIQGHIWRRGYESGEIKSLLFEDILPTFKRILKSGARIAIYSSGSREAQQLIFKHSKYGDLTSYISSYFDTKVGGKREKQSYQEIALSLGLEPKDILFFTDIIEEAQAAKASGVDSVLSVREGNIALPASHEFKELTTFYHAV